MASGRKQFPIICVSGGPDKGFGDHALERNKHLTLAVQGQPILELDCNVGEYFAFLISAIEWQNNKKKKKGAGSSN